MSVLEHYNALARHGMEGLVNFMIAHDASAFEDAGEQDNDEEGPFVKPVSCSEEQVAELREVGIECMIEDLADARYPTWHDPVKLRHAFSEVLDECRSTRM